MYEYLNQKLNNVLMQTGILLAVLISNVLVATIWLSKENRNAVSILLTVIALYDTLTIICGTVNVTTSYIAGQLFSVGGCYVVKVMSTLAFVFHSLSSASTTFLAIQRSIVCAFPFGGPKRCGLKTTTAFAIVSFIVIVVYKVPELLFSNIDGIIKTADDNSSVLYCQADYIFGDAIASELTNMYLRIQVFVFHLAPLCITTFCSIVCLVTINRNAVDGQTSQQSKKTRITIMLVLIMIIFVLGKLPKAISVFYRAFLPTDPIWLTTRSGDWFSNMALVASFLANIWVYMAMSKPFRERLKERCCSYVKHARNIYSETQTSVYHVSRDRYTGFKG